MSLSRIDIKTLKRRLRRKGFGHTLSALLLFSKKDAEGKPCSPLADSYARSLHCMDQWVVSEGVMTSHYCKNRWCPECNRIRTAVLINTYMPRLVEEFGKDGLYFVTLTRRNVQKEDLKQELQEYHKIWSVLTDKATFRHRLRPDKAVKAHLQKAENARKKAEMWQNRDCFTFPNRDERVQHFLSIERKELQLAEKWKGVNPMIGLRKLECTYHHQKYLIYRQKGGIVQYQTDICGNKIADPWHDTYHPHFHILVNSKEMAEWLISTWLELCGDKADAKAQHYEAVYDSSKKESRKGKKGLLEIFKYFTKLISKIEVPGTKDGRWHIFANELDNIFTAMAGRRVFQRFGKDEIWRCAEVDEDNIEEEATIEGLEDDVYEFIQSGIWGDGEWAMVSRQTGDILVSVQRTGKLCDMLRDSEEVVGVDQEQLHKIEEGPPH